MPSHQHRCSSPRFPRRASSEPPQLAEEGYAHAVRSTPIVMCGCLPSRYGDDLPDELPEVAAFVPADKVTGSSPWWTGCARTL